MNTVTIRTKESDYNLKLDFNRNISEALEKIGVELSGDEILVTLLYKQVVNPKLSFNDNGIANNEIIEIKERYEGELWFWEIRYYRE